MTGRTEKAGKNIFYGYVSTIITLVLGFASRTIFIQVLGTTYLGINGLFTNVLAVLSFAELGFGTAVNFSLYKPVAEGDYEKIKSLMAFYKKVYRIIALIVGILGLAILPFLKHFIKGAESFDDLSIYYLIFLFNTVSSYFFSYKFSLLNAEQKNYVFTNINIITNIVTLTVQMVMLLVFKNFFLYLLSASIIGLVSKIYFNFYLNKHYPIFIEKDIKRLSKAELAPIKRDVKALIWHKIGEISVHQTDNIVIATFLNVAIVGIISNYNLIITSVSSFITIIFSSIVSSFGNLIATESKEKQYEMFKIYRFLAFWSYGFSSIAFYILLTPFITLWIGESMAVSQIVIFLIILNYYMMGHRIVINNVKIAGGVFNQDKFVALLQAVVNLVVSIIMVKLIGLPGVYIGTIAQGTLSTIIKPIIVYREVFNAKPKEYFIDGLKYLTVIIIALIVCIIAQKMIMPEITVLAFVVLVLFVGMVANLIFLLFFRKSKEFIYLKKLILSKLRRKYR